MNSLLVALRQTSRSMRLVGLMYSVTLLLGLLAALPFYNTLLAEDQNSLAFLKLLDGFDYTVYADFMHRSQQAIAPLFSVGRMLGVLYIFLSIFFAGGILVRFAQPAGTFRAGLFWQASSHYVSRFLRLSGVTLLFVLVGAGLWLVIGSLVGVALSDDLTERGLFWVGLVFFMLFALTATVLLCVGDYAKVLMVREDEHGAFRAFGQASRLVFRNLPQTYGLYLLLILIGTGCFGLYFLIDAFVPMKGWVTILGMLVVQQCLIFVRVGLKVWSLGTVYLVYGDLPRPLVTSDGLLISREGVMPDGLEP